MQKLVSLVMGSRETAQSETPWLQSITRHLKDKSLYAVGFCSELLLTNDDTLLFSLDTYAADNNTLRKKAVFHHKASLFQLLSLYFIMVSTI